MKYVALLYNKDFQDFREEGFQDFEKKNYIYEEILRILNY